MKLLLGAAVLAAFAVLASACGNSNRIVSPPTNSSTVSLSDLVSGGRVRCTATLTTPTPVRVGQQIGFVFRFHNVSTRTAKVFLQPGSPWVRVSDPDRKAYDSRDFVNWRVGPTGSITPIRPGATMTERLRLPVRWQGPLRVTPGCTTTALRTIPVDVTSPGLPTSRGHAISEVVAAAGHLLDHCRPRTSAVAVVGRIDPPRGDAPPLQARCSVILRRERGYYLAQVLVVTPPNLRGVHLVQRPYEEISIPNVESKTGPCCGSTRDAEAVAWEFVVTRRGATSVDSNSVATTLAGGSAIPEGIWTSAGWPRPSSGSYSCGGSLGSGLGGLGAWNGVRGPDVAFVSVCGR